MLLSKLQCLQDFVGLYQLNKTLTQKLQFGLDHVLTHQQEWEVLFDVEHCVIHLPRLDQKPQFRPLL